MKSDAKKEQRDQVRHALAQFSEESRRAASVKIIRQIFECPDFALARTVALYAALPIEPEMRDLFLRMPQRTVFPRVNTETWTISLHQVRAWEDLKPGKFNILEPNLERAVPVLPEDIDFILVPGLAFDRAGGRLGRGGGFYDRLLAKLPAKTLCVGCFFSCQEVGQVVQEPHDQRLDAIVTENEWIVPAVTRSL